MLISTKGRYALRLMLDFAEHQNEGTIPLNKAADRLQLSEKYLESIVSSLTIAGLLYCTRGKNGGYRLCRDAGEYTVYEILSAAELTLNTTACTGEKCERSHECKTYPLWQGLDETVRNYLRAVTLKQLSEGIYARS